jgi:hypothetical protein
MCKKMFYLIICVLALGFVAGIATADPIVYEFTVDGGEFGGTITFDTDFAPNGNEVTGRYGSGSEDIYTWGQTDAIVSFSFFQSGDTEGVVYTQDDNNANLEFRMDSADDTPLFIQDIGHMTDSVTGDAMLAYDMDFVGIIEAMVAGVGVVETGQGEVTGLAMTVPEPATMGLLALGGLLKSYHTDFRKFSCIHSRVKPFFTTT